MFDTLLKAIISGHFFLKPDVGAPRHEIKACAGMIRPVQVKLKGIRPIRTVSQVLKWIIQRTVAILE